MRRVVRTRDGEPLVIRTRVPDDARLILDMARALVADGRGEVRSDGDLPEDAAELRTRLERRDDLVGLVGEVNGVVVGQATVAGFSPALLKHVGVLGMGVHPEHQRRGVGGAILDALVDAARAKRIVRLELYVRADNDRARRLYESRSFVHEATRRRFVRLPDGREIDDCIYVRFL